MSKLINEAFKESIGIRSIEKGYTNAEFNKYLLNHYEMLAQSGILVTKHHTHDAIFFICNEGRWGFKVIKFYTDTFDMRIGTSSRTAGEAYSDALCWM